MKEYFSIMTLLLNFDDKAPLPVVAFDVTAYPEKVMINAVGWG